MENLGAVAVNARQQLERLKTLDLRPGDAVIFYDGVNEIYQALYHHHPRGWTADDLEGPPASLPLHRRVVITVYNRLYHRSRFVTYFLDPYDTETVPVHLREPETRRRLVTELAKAYEATLLEAHRFSADRGAEFHHFLQPNLFTVDSRSAYEERLLASHHFTPNGLDVGFTFGYPELQAVVRRLAARGVSSHDLTSLLNERTNGEEFFLDFCHVNHEANRRIAESIAAHAFPTG